MSKSKLSLVFSNERGTKAKLYTYEYDENQSAPSTDDTFSPIGVVFDHPASDESALPGQFPVAAQVWGMPLLTWDAFNDLTGKMLTIIDASVQDKEQRKALKDVVRATLESYKDNHKDRVTQTYQSVGIGSGSKQEVKFTELAS